MVRVPSSKLLVFVSVVLAGCAAADPKNADPAAPSPSADDTLGSVTGLIVDTEERPVAGAAVQLAGTMLATTSDNAGTFTINAVPPGQYTLFVDRLGYESRGVRVAVQAGNITTMRLVLVGIPIGQEPYVSAQLRVIQIHVDNIYLSDCFAHCSGYVNHSQINSLRCDPCQVVLHLAPKPSAALTEAMWPPSAAAVINPNMCYYYYRNWSESDAGTFVQHDCLTNRGGSLWSDVEVRTLQSATTVKAYVHGATVGVSFQHRIDLWTSFGYFGELPDGYSALPPS